MFPKRLRRQSMLPSLASIVVCCGVKEEAPEKMLLQSKNRYSLKQHSASYSAAERQQFRGIYRSTEEEEDASS